MKRIKDYRGEEVLLECRVWKDHTSINHSEMTLELLESILKDPDLVCSSQHRHMIGSKLYYQVPWKNMKGKDRYFRIVVKTCVDGNWMATAHTRSSISCGTVIYRKEKL